MSLPIEIKDGVGDGFSAKVNSQHALLVTNVNPVGSESIDQITRYKVWYDYFKDIANSQNQAVDGSTTPVSFKIQPEDDRIKFITDLRMVINGTGCEIETNDFRDYSASYTAGLTNGIELNIVQSGVETALFIEPIKTIGDYLNYADTYTNIVNSISAQSDFLSVDIHFSQPIALAPGTNDYIDFVYPLEEDNGMMHELADISLWIWLNTSLFSSSN